MRNLLLSAWVLHILTCQYVLSSKLNVLRRKKRYAACAPSATEVLQHVEHNSAWLYSDRHSVYSFFLTHSRTNPVSEPQPLFEVKERLPKSDVERVLVKGTGLLPNETLLVQSSSSVVHVVKDYEFKVTYVTCLGVAPHDRKIGGCHFEDNELSGIIKSPMYPAFYPLEAYCEAKVEVPYGNVIRFRIEDIDLCPRAGNVLTFIDGEGLGGPKLKVVTPEPEEKEDSLNGTIISPGRKVTVVFSASCERGAKNRGFHITYEALPSESSDGKGACGKPVLANPGDATNQEGSKIVRGNDAKIGAHPWQVLLKHLKTDDPFCGGSLISHRWVLTAAHCFKQYSRHDVRVVLGKHSLVTRDENEITLSIKKLVIHPDFDNRTLNNDIALLELRAAIQYSARFSPICLGDAQFIEQMAFRSPTPVLGFASGWGRVNIKGPRPENLQEVRLPVLRKQVCLESSSAAVRKKITDNMFCAGYDDQPVVMDTCEGDSGGPFVVELRGTWYLVGIVSWSHQSKCGVPGRYGFYTKVNNYNEWILDTVNARRSGTS